MFKDYTKEKKNPRKIKRPKIRIVKLRLCILLHTAYLCCVLKERRVIEKMVIMKFSSETQEHEMYTRYYILSFFTMAKHIISQPQVAIEDLLQKFRGKSRAIWSPT